MIKTFMYEDIDFKDEVGVKRFLDSFTIADKVSSRTKHDVLLATLDRSANEYGYTDPLLAKIYFDLHLLLGYSNLRFSKLETGEEKDLLEVYDSLEDNGFMDKFFSLLPQQELDEMTNYLEVMIEDRDKHSMSVTSFLQTLIIDLPNKVALAKEALKGFNQEEVQNVIELAKVTGYQG